MTKENPAYISPAELWAIARKIQNNVLTPIEGMKEHEFFLFFKEYEIAYGKLKIVHTQKLAKHAEAERGVDRKSLAADIEKSKAAKPAKQAKPNGSDRVKKSLSPEQKKRQKLIDSLTLLLGSQEAAENQVNSLLKEKTK